MIGNCATCRHWERDDYQTGYRGRETGECKMGRSHGGYPDDPAALAYSVDSDCYSASMYTDPAFGCPQWAAQPAPESSTLRRESID